MIVFKNAIEISKKICRLKLNDGDRAVDCTMGNGNDTAFLCSLVGTMGKVYAFDIQEDAVMNTSKRLRELNFLERTELILDGHQNIDRYIKEPVQLVIFNLGYLPKGNHEITTKTETTLEAIRKCMDIIDLEGIILIVVYPGHEKGKEEKEALEGFISEINQKVFNAAYIRFPNQINNPPELICIERVETRNKNVK